MSSDEVEDAFLCDLVEAEIRAAVPAATQVATTVIGRRAGKAMVIAEVMANEKALAPLVAVLIEIDKDWIVWGLGAEDQTFEIEGACGPVAKAYRVEPGTATVQFIDQTAQVVEVQSGPVAFAIIWCARADADISWPAIQAIEVRGQLLPPVADDLAVTRDFLIGEFIAEQIGDAEGGWAWNTVADLVDENPALAWDLIRAAIVRAHDDEVVSRIGAGHLETLLRCHGELLEREIAEAAMRSEAVQRALLAAWAPLPRRVATVLARDQ